MASEMYKDAARLVLEERWGSLATLDGGTPVATMVAYAAEPSLGGLLFHLSGMAAHTRNLLEEPRCSLAITRPDTGKGDPQLLPRVSLRGQAVPIDDEAVEEARALYIARFPDSEQRFELGDFALFRFVPEEARYVGGFARASRITPAQLSEAVEKP